MKIGFIGLGIMGKPMAKNLLKAGYTDLLVNNRSAAPMEELAACGATAATQQEIGEQCDVVITMLPNSPQVREVMLGADGVAAHMKAGATFIECSSINPVASKEIAAALAENADAAHITPVCGDLRQLCTAGPEQGQYDFAACNPPYFTAGPRSPDPRRAEARHTGSCTTADAVDCARRALRDGGRFLLCQRPEQLAEILAALRAARLEPKRLAFVKNRPDAAPWLFLVEAQKGRKTGLRVEPDILIQSGAALYGPTTL